MSISRFLSKAVRAVTGALPDLQNPGLLKKVPDALFTWRLPTPFTSTKTFAFTSGPSGLLLNRDASVTKADVMAKRQFFTFIMKEIIQANDFPEVLKKIEENPKDLGFIRDLHPELREKAALYLANTNPKSLAPMTNFNIVNKECFKEVIQILLKKDPSDLTENNRANSHYKFTESEWKIIVDIMLEGKLDAYGSHAFGSIMWDAKFTERDLAEITPKLLEKDLENVSGYIHKLNLSKKEKYEVAEKLIEVNPKSLVVHMCNFDLYFLDFIRIVDKLTYECPRTLINNFVNFDSRDTVRVAENLVHSNPNVLIENIFKFKLSEFGRKEIALRLAEKNPNFLAQNISNFKLNEEDRKEIALKLLMMDKAGMSHYNVQSSVIYNFKLSEGSLRDLGHKLIEKEHIGHFLNNPRAFKLDYEDRKKMADLIVKRELPYVFAATHISNLELTKEDLKEYAYKLLDMEGTVEDLVQNIHLFKLDSVDLNYIANKLLDRHAGFLVRGISKFNLSEADLIAIVHKLPDDALKSLAERTSCGNIGLENRTIIAFELVEINPELLIENLSKFDLIYKDYEEILLKFVDKNLEHLLKDDFLNDDLIVKILKKKPELFSEFVKRVSRDEVLPIVISLYGEWLHTGKGNPMTGSEIEQISSRVIKYSHPTIRENSFNVFLEQISSSSYQSIYGEYTRSHKKNEPIFTVHKMLPAIFLSKWQAELKESVEPSKRPFLDFLNNPEIRLALRREVGSPLMQNLLLAMTALDKDTSIGPKEKCAILEQVCNIKTGQFPPIQEISDVLGQLSVICNCNEGFILNYTFIKSAKEEISLAWGPLITRHSYADLKGIENIGEKYQNTFGQIPITGAL